MRRKLIAGFICAAMPAVLLTACGSRQNSAAAGESVGSEATESTEAAGTDNGKVALTVWGAEEDQALLAEIVESFQQEYAGQADFEITIAAESESTCKDTLLGDIGNAPDVFTFVDDQLMAMVAGGVLAPVPDADTVRAENSEGAVEAASVGDTLYAYPMTADNGYFMYYNKEYFSEEDVATLDGMLAIAAENGKKVAMDWSSGWYLYSFFGNTGLTVGLNDDGISNYCTWNATDGDIKGVDVAQAMLDIAANPGFGNMVDADFLAGVADGSVIAGVSGVWDSSAVQEAWGSNYGAVKLPTYTCAGQQIQMASFAGYKMVGANAYSEHVDWALKLAQWITNEQNQTLRFQERGQGPSNINAADTDEVNNDQAIQALLQQSEFASLQRIGGEYWTPVQEFGMAMAAGNPEGQGLQELLDTMVEEVTFSNAQ